MSYRKATPQERNAYQGMYPLHALCHTADGHLVAIEDLRGSWAKPDPTWEVCAPDGWHFTADGVYHSRLCDSLAEAKTIARQETLERCRFGPLGDC